MIRDNNQCTGIIDKTIYVQTSISGKIDLVFGDLLSPIYYYFLYSLWYTFTASSWWPIPLNKSAWETFLLDAPFNLGHINIFSCKSVYTKPHCRGQDVSSYLFLKFILTLIIFDLSWIINLCCWSLKEGETRYSWIFRSLYGMFFILLSFLTLLLCFNSLSLCFGK